MENEPCPKFVDPQSKHEWLKMFLSEMTYAMKI